MRRLGVGGVQAIAELLESSGAQFAEDVQVMATTVMAAMSGVSRRMLEASKAPDTLEAMREGLQVMVRAYVNACAVPAEASSSRASAR